MLAATSAQAQLLSIQSDGSTSLYKGPVIASPDGVVPLRFQTERTHSSISAPLRAAADRHAVSRELIAAIAWQESRMNQAAVSPKGARGIMQLMPATARRLGVDPNDLSANLDGGTRYLTQLLDRFNGDVIMAIAAYNAGPEAVARYRGIPPFPETQAYVDGVLARLAEQETQ
jgi:soluble lytic murein transglycosylase-like protein